MSNILLTTDSYKISHYRQYPPETTNVYSYFTSRGGSDEIVFFGLQYIMKEYLEGVRVTIPDIDEAEEIFAGHFGDPTLFNRAGWEHIVSAHGGKLPVEICAVPEGSVNKSQAPLLSIENTCDECYWVTNYLETLLVQLWYPCSVATNSREAKKVIHSFLEKNGTPSLIDFKLHDFGFRGVSSVESAGIGGAAHLINFMGTDTLAALLVTRKYYKIAMAGFSIPAAEHSTITSWGKDHELDAYANMLVKYPTGLVAVVSDSYDIFNACKTLWGDKLKDQVFERDGVLVVRPDSGDPAATVLRVLDTLGEAFGFYFNKKGYKMLPDKIRVIQGDGINNYSLFQILQWVDQNGWSADNIAFGMGGGLLQMVNRDTYKFALKCSSVIVDGKEREVFKSPVGDHDKRSFGGRKVGLIPVFRNGEILKEYGFEEIRKNATISPVAELVESVNGA